MNELSEEAIALRVVSGVVEVLPAGELDIATTPALDATLQAAFDHGGSAVCVELSAVTFLDAAVLGTFVLRSRASREIGLLLYGVAAMLAVAELTWGREDAGKLKRQPGLGARCQIRRAADQPGDLRGDRVEHLARCVARGQSGGARGERWQSRFPVAGQLTSAAWFGTFTLRQTLRTLPPAPIR